MNPLSRTGLNLSSILPNAKNLLHQREMLTRQFKNRLKKIHSKNISSPPEDEPETTSIPVEAVVKVTIDVTVVFLEPDITVQTEPEPNLRKTMTTKMAIQNRFAAFSIFSGAFVAGYNLAFQRIESL